ncbi:MAG: HAD-IIIC family phosphatase [Chloroflexi bacterium]|nr:HAD-IIIC family phosphatase [Chloroflexota bacterium]
MRDRDALIERLASAGDPLGAAVAVLGADLGSLLEATERFGARPSTRHARALVDLGGSLAARTPPVELVEGGTPARSWLRAGLLAARGEHDAACDAAASAAYDEDPELRSFRELFCARQLARASDAATRSRAWPHLRRAALAAIDLGTLLTIDRLRGKLAGDGQPSARLRIRLAVLGTPTLDLLAPAIRAACFGRGISAELFVGGYGLYQQELLGPDPRLDAFAPEAVALLIDGSSLGVADESPDPDAVVAREVERLGSLWRQAQERWNCTVFQSNFVVPAVDPYGGLSASLPGGRAQVLRRLGLELWSAAARESGVHIIDVDQLASVVGKTVWDDPAAWHAAKQLPGPRAVPTLAHGLAGMLQAAGGLSAKCLVVDLDNTLWGGVVGDDGVEGIELGDTPAGEAYVAFQRYLLSLSRRGVALAVCSKNDDAAARAPFRAHPEMVLGESDFARFIANWEPKPDNLRGIAKALNIGLDRIVFVDDNPMERELVRRTLPEVRVVDLPLDPAGFPGAVAGTLAFEMLALTGEDRQRAASFRAMGQLAAESSASPLTLDAFIDSLDMTVDIAPFREQDVPRLHQLVNKTNQFNLTTTRMSEVEVRKLVADERFYARSVRLRDRFGDHGLVAILIARHVPTELRVEQWLMSCRVFGRRLEDVMIAHAAEAALAGGAVMLTGVYKPTDKNGQFRDLYERLGFSLAREDADGSLLFTAEARAIAARQGPKVRVVAPATR